MAEFYVTQEVEFYMTQEKAMAPEIAGEWPRVIPKPDSPHGRLVKLEGVQEAIDGLVLGCEHYHGWWSKSEPARTPHAVAYELVCRIRQALVKLNGLEEE